MKKAFTFIVIVFFSALTAVTVSGQTVPKIVWQKAVGGTGIDSLASLCIAADKSIVLCGTSNSDKSGNKSENGYGGKDIWVVKMNASGTILWDKTFGGKKDDVASAVIATSDGGFLIGGTSISDKSSTKTAPSFRSSNDFWVIKLNAGGTKLWDKTFGGSFTDKLTSLAQLPSGNYAVGGLSFSDSSFTKMNDNIGSENTADYWMLTIDKSGKLLSQDTYGGTSDDVLTSIAAAGTTGIYAGGNSYSLTYAGYKKQPSYGNNDYWIVRTNLNNKKIFEVDFGGDRSEYLTSMQSLSDNSVVMAGYSNSTASFSKSNAFLGVTDFWLLKMNSSGSKQWDRTIGGKGGDYLASIQSTNDKGFILGGFSNSDIGNDKTENSRGGYDYWMVKTDRQGKVVWDKTFGGNRNDVLAGAYELDSGRYIIAGTSSSGISGDKTSRITGGGTAADYWVLCVSELPQNLAASTLQTNTLNAAFSITSNPVKNQLTVNYSAKQNSSVSFFIYSSEGRLMNQYLLTAASQNNTYSFDVSRFAGGAYYIAMLTADGNKISRPFIKQ